MAKSTTAIQWFDRLHILTTFAVVLKRTESEENVTPIWYRNIARDALIETLGLEAFSSTASEEAFDAAFENGEAFREAREALGEFQPISDFVLDRKS